MPPAAPSAAHRSRSPTRRPASGARSRPCRPAPTSACCCRLAGTGSRPPRPTSRRAPGRGGPRGRRAGAGRLPSRDRPGHGVRDRRGVRRGCPVRHVRDGVAGRHPQESRDCRSTGATSSSSPRSCPGPSCRLRVAEFDAGRCGEHQRAREQANNFLLDGVDNNDLYINQIVVPPALDSVQEFKIQSGSLQRRVRPQRRRPVQRGDEGRDQPVARLGVRVLS